MEIKYSREEVGKIIVGYVRNTVNESELTGKEIKARSNGYGEVEVTIEDREEAPDAGKNLPGD